MTPQEIRRSAAAILLSAAAFFAAHPDRWLRHAMAETAEGRVVPSYHDEACRFCALARIIVEAGEQTDLLIYNLALDAMHYQILASGWNPPAPTAEASIPSWNDAQTEAAPVIAMIRAAAATFA